MASQSAPFLVWQNSSWKKTFGSLAFHVNLTDVPSPGVFENWFQWLDSLNQSALSWLKRAYEMSLQECSGPSDEVVKMNEDQRTVSQYWMVFSNVVAALKLETVIGIGWVQSVIVAVSLLPT